MVFGSFFGLVVGVDGLDVFVGFYYVFGFVCVGVGDDGVYGFY